jgi:hydrogenase expression/formation protein HypE
MGAGTQRPSNGGLPTQGALKRDELRIALRARWLIICSAMGGDTIQLDHGKGGGLSHALFCELIAPRFGSANTAVAAANAVGAAIVELDSERVALATSSFMVDPMFFGNGDVGSLAVCATINDLAVAGAVPRYLTMSLVIEEGLPIADLERVLDSVHHTAVEAGVSVVAGDTRVVRRGEVDKLSLSAGGVGEVIHELKLGSEHVRPGDAVIVTGPLGQHGVHILALRAGLERAGGVLSDSAPLDGLVWNVFEDYARQVRCMRSLARGGIAAALNELADRAGVSIEVDKHHLPIRRETKRVAARLGIDPLLLPSEGSICMIVAEATAAKVAELIRWQPQGGRAQIVGRVRERGDAAVTMARPGDDDTLGVLKRGSEPPRLR